MHRRRFLETAALGAAIRSLHAGGRDFWETKEPAEWSSEQKRTLLEQSPWAREGMVRFELEPQPVRPAPEYDQQQRPGAGVPGSRPGNTPGAVTSVPIGGEAPPPAPRADTGRPVQFRVLARWETAAPVRMAGAPELPEEIAGFYVIRLRGLPLMPAKKKDGEDAPSNPNEALLAALKENTRIERKDKAPMRCSHLLTGPGDAGTEVLLFFARGKNAITAADKTVTLESRFGPFHLTVKFPLKDMMYKGKLAL